MELVRRVPVAIFEWISAIRPLKYTAVDIDNISIARFLDAFSDFFASNANRTVNNNPGIFGDVLKCPSVKVLIANMSGTGDVTDLKFFLLTGIKNHDTIPDLQQGVDIDRIDT